MNGVVAARRVVDDRDQPGSQAGGSRGKSYIDGAARTCRDVGRAIVGLGKVSAYLEAENGEQPVTNIFQHNCDGRACGAHQLVMENRNGCGGNECASADAGAGESDYLRAVGRIILETEVAASSSVSMGMKIDLHAATCARGDRFPFTRIGVGKVNFVQMEDVGNQQGEGTHIGDGEWVWRTSGSNLLSSEDQAGGG